MHNNSAWKLGRLFLLSITSGIASGYLICPILNYLMGTVPVPYEWISDLEEHWRFPVFLFGAYLLFLATSSLTVGVSAALIGYSFKSYLWFPATLIFSSTAVTYCCFIFDSRLLTHFTHWIIQPTSWLYISELISLLLLVTFMTWFGSTLRYIREYCAENTDSR